MLTYLFLFSPLQGIRSQFHVYFVPHRSVACEQMLEDEGVLDMVTIGEYKLGFVPLDSDILSLEMIDLYHEVIPDSHLLPHPPFLPPVLPQWRLLLSQYCCSLDSKTSIIVWKHS
jgi:hypothetical protein